MKKEMHEVKIEKGTIYERGYGMIGKVVMQDPNITIEAKAIYSYFCSYAGVTGKAFPTVDGACYHLNISKNRYFKHLQILIDNGYIERNKARHKNGKFLHNVYTIVLKPCIQNRDMDNEDIGNRYNENLYDKSIIFKSNSIKSNMDKSIKTNVEVENLQHLTLIEGYQEIYKSIKGKEHPPIKDADSIIDELYKITDSINENKLYIFNSMKEYISSGKGDGNIHHYVGGMIYDYLDE